jgi:hypothetical protein
MSTITLREMYEDYLQSERKAVRCEDSGEPYHVWKFEILTESTTYNPSGEVISSGPRSVSYFMWIFPHGATHLTKEFSLNALGKAKRKPPTRMVDLKILGDMKSWCNEKYYGGQHADETTDCHSS